MASKKAQQTVEITLEDAMDEFDAQQQGFSESAEYYDATTRDFSVGIATPVQLRKLTAQVGIPRLYIDSLADRLIVEGFRMGSDSNDELWSWFEANSLDTHARSAYIEAMVYGRAYITVSVPSQEDALNPLIDPEMPMIRLESPLSLYAKIDPRTRQVLWAVRVVKNEDGETVGATLYTQVDTQIYVANEGELVQQEVISHNLGVVPVVPIIRAEGVSDTKGTSMITPELKSITDAISRTLMDMQTASALMAAPQRVLFGTSREEVTNEGELTPLETYLASTLIIDEPTGKATQFDAADLANYTNAMGFMLKMAAAYTGLPPQYLSFQDDNPASAEAIRASESRLVMACEALSRPFGEAWEQAMRIAMLVMGQQLTPDAFRMETVWRDPSTPTYAAMADATTKLYANGMGVISKRQARVDMGYSPEEIRLMEEDDEQDPMAQAVSMYGSVEGVSGESGSATGGSGPSGESGDSGS